MVTRIWPYGYIGVGDVRIEWETERGVFEARAQRENSLIVLAKKIHDEIKI